MTLIRVLTRAGTFLAAASVALAQGGSASSVTFAPLPVATAPGSPAPEKPAGTGYSAVTATANNFAAGMAVNSPVTGQAIPAEAVQSVGALIAGGGVAAAASVVASLTRAGAPPAPTSQLTQSLVELASANSGNAHARVTAAIQSYNAFVSQAPASFFAPANLPAQFLAIHAALSAMGAAVR